MCTHTHTWSFFMPNQSATSYYAKRKILLFGNLHMDGHISHSLSFPSNMVVNGCENWHHFSFFVYYTDARIHQSMCIIYDCEHKWMHNMDIPERNGIVATILVYIEGDIVENIKMERERERGWSAHRIVYAHQHRIRNGSGWQFYRKSQPHDKRTDNFSERRINYELYSCFSFYFRFVQFFFLSSFPFYMIQLKWKYVFK